MVHTLSMCITQSVSVAELPYKNDPQAVTGNAAVAAARVVI